MPDEITLKWLGRAQSDCNLAELAINSDKVELEDVCFHLQQCVEKALKAILISKNQEFPYSHSIGLMIKKLEDIDIKVPDYVRDGLSLSAYAVETRYPGEWTPIEKEEAEGAMVIAKNILYWVKTYLGIEEILG